MPYNPFVPDRDKAKRAHARLSVALPVRIYSPLKISAPIEPDDPKPQKRDEYVPAWKRRGVWDV